MPQSRWSGPARWMSDRTAAPDATCALPVAAWRPPPRSSCVWGFSSQSAGRHPGPNLSGEPAPSRLAQRPPHARRTLPGNVSLAIMGRAAFVALGNQAQIGTNLPAIGKPGNIPQFRQEDQRSHQRHSVQLAQLATAGWYRGCSGHSIKAQSSRSISLSRKLSCLSWLASVCRIPLPSLLSRHNPRSQARKLLLQPFDTSSARQPVAFQQTSDLSLQASGLLRPIQPRRTSSADHSRLWIRELQQAVDCRPAHGPAAIAKSDRRHSRRSCSSYARWNVPSSSAARGTGCRLR